MIYIIYMAQLDGRKDGDISLAKMLLLYAVSILYIYIYIFIYIYIYMKYIKYMYIM